MDGAVRPEPVVRIRRGPRALAAAAGGVKGPRVSTEAPVLPCRGCGAPLAVDPETADASCGACRTVTRVPDALRERARAYRRSIGAERGRVERARRTSKDAFAKMGVYFGPPLALVIIGHIVATMLIDESYQQEEMFAFYGGLGLVGVVYFAWLVVTIRADNRGDDPTPAMVAAAAATPSSRLHRRNVLQLRREGHLRRRAGERAVSLLRRDGIPPRRRRSSRCWRSPRRRATSRWVAPAARTCAASR